MPDMVLSPVWEGVSSSVAGIIGLFPLKDNLVICGKTVYDLRTIDYWQPDTVLHPEEPRSGVSKDGRGL